VGGGVLCALGVPRVCLHPSVTIRAHLWGTKQGTAGRHSHCIHWDHTELQQKPQCVVNTSLEMRDQGQLLLGVARASRGVSCKEYVRLPLLIIHHVAGREVGLELEEIDVVKAQGEEDVSVDRVPATPWQ